MQFQPGNIKGLATISLTPIKDERGSFSRVFCQKEFSENGIPGNFSQANLSINPKAGTFRGLHFQMPPFSEGKLIRCQRGAIYDIALDMRPDSSTYLNICGVHLDSTQQNMLFVPAGCAHGFLTLEDNTEVLYMATHPYHPTAERGIRFNDPIVTIALPRSIEVISEKDSSWPDLSLANHAKQWRPME